MLAYKNRVPDMTLAKLNDRKRQRYPNRELKESQKLRNLQYVISRAITLNQRLRFRKAGWQ